MAHEPLGIIPGGMAVHPCKLATAMIVTFRTLKILKAFITNPTVPRGCYSLAREQSLKKPTVKDTLQILAKHQWLRDASMLSTAANRRQRHLYVITELGIREGSAALAELQMASTLGVSANLY